MRKTVLTLDEINLLKNSEEPKNTQLYGNLYENIVNLSKFKAVSIEDMPFLDELGVASLTINKKNMMNNILKEWYAEKVSEEDPTQKVHCGLCNTPNKYLYYIRNRRNDILLNVGSHCILKFPGIEGYTEKKRQLNEIIKGREVVNRRNKFYETFRNAESVISDADKYFSTLPILIPYELYTNIQNTIVKMRQVYSQYINKGKTKFDGNLSPFELFQNKFDEYNLYKNLANKFIQENDKPLSCKRAEIDWLISNKKIKLLEEISKNNGLYTELTLKHMTSVEFIKPYIKNIFSRNTSRQLYFSHIKGNMIYINLHKFGYNPNLVFQMTLEDFMDKIGAKCIINKNIKYDLEKCFNQIAIIVNQSNIFSILGYISTYTNNTQYVFLNDYIRDNIYLYRKTDKAIRKFNAQSFIKAYSGHLLNSEETMKKHILNMIYNNSVQWISLEQQSKQGTDDIVRKLYKEFKE